MQRWLVNVSEKEDFVRFKPANLELVRPGPDKPRYWPAGVHIRELVFDIGSHPPVAKLARRGAGSDRRSQRKRSGGREASHRRRARIASPFLRSADRPSAGSSSWPPSSASTAARRTKARTGTKRRSISRRFRRVSAMTTGGRTSARRRTTDAS